MTPVFLKMDMNTQRSFYILRDYLALKCYSKYKTATSPLHYMQLIELSRNLTVKFILETHSIIIYSDINNKCEKQFISS